MSINPNDFNFLANVDPKRDLFAIEKSGQYRGASLLQCPSVFNFKRIAATLPGAGAALSQVGTAITATGGAITHVGSATQGFFANLPSVATINTGGGIHQTDAAFYRGSSPLFNGVNLRSRVLLPDGSYNEAGASTGSRIGIGLTTGTIATTFASDNPAIERIMFRRHSVNGGAIDTNWMVSVRGASAETLINTGMLFEVNKVYDLGFDLDPAGDTVNWFIFNATDNVLATGSINTNLPQAATALRAFLGLFTVNAAIRNIRMGHLVTECAL
jgi:hypothetical protein